MRRNTMKTATLAFAASLLLAQAAGAREFADIYTDCGLGALIAPRTPAVAAVTNVTFDLGTTAIISNVSSPETCQGGKALAAAFINDAYEPLEADLARGQGKYLDSLAVLAGVREEGKTAFADSLRKNFAGSIAAEGYADRSRFEKAENLYNLVFQQPDSRS
ncbi:DUF3015 family protein [Candidatus Electronema sp. JC]|uniref:DUF3015 family protein n=1 Tax=Candidatus Electronema sp. JC TaxID=3401570 RepID=UPI003B42BE21